MNILVTLDRNYLHPLRVMLGSLYLNNPGETFDVTVTFPEDYGNEDLNGKEAVFETTLNYIKESVTPELTDDWVKENLGESMSLNSVDELKAFVKSTMLYDLSLIHISEPTRRS